MEYIPIRKKLDDQSFNDLVPLRDNRDNLGTDMEDI